MAYPNPADIVASVGDYTPAPIPTFKNDTGYFPPAPAPPGTYSPNLWGSDAAKGLDLGWNMGTADLALGGLQTIGNLWSAWNANKLAKDQFDFQKKMSLANFENSAQSYNTTLSDRAKARQSYTGVSDADAQAYIDANKLRSTI